MYEACPECKDKETFYAYYGNTAVNLERPPVSRARLTVVDPALFESDVFEMAASIQSPAKCEVRSVIRFLNAKGERPYIGTSSVQSRPRAQRLPLISSPKETSCWEKVSTTMMRCKKS